MLYNKGYLSAWLYFVYFSVYIPGTHMVLAKKLWAATVSAVALNKIK